MPYNIVYMSYHKKLLHQIEAHTDLSSGKCLRWKSSYKNINN